MVRTWREIKDIAVRRYLAHPTISLAQAADGFCSRDTLRRELIARGIARKQKGHRGQQNAARDEAMMAHRDAGLTYTEIGCIFGITKTGALFAVRRARVRKDT